MKFHAILLASSIFLCGCGEFLSDSGSEKKPSFEITTSKQVYNFGQEIEVTFTNNDEEEVVYWYCPSILQKKIDDQWQVVDRITCTTLRVRPESIKNGETYSIVQSWFVEGPYNEEDNGVFRLVFSLVYTNSNTSLPFEHRQSEPFTVRTK